MQTRGATTLLPSPATPFNNGLIAASRGPELPSSEGKSLLDVKRTYKAYSSPALKPCATARSNSEGVAAWYRVTIEGETGKACVIPSDL